MMRSNNKMVRARVRAHILDHLEAEPITVIGAYARFRNEKGHELDGRFGSHKNRKVFKDWLGGLALPIPVYYGDVRKEVQYFMHQTAEQASKYGDIEVWDLYLHLFADEFFKMVEEVLR